MSMRPDSRIAITGPNGAGKSTLLRLIIGTLTIPPERILSIPQEITPDMASDAVQDTRALPGPLLGRLMTMVSRLGSDPENLLRTAEPSPGEIRKLMLALGLIHEPHIVIMDEPTNHMDLVSIQCLESALDDCGCALLLVSHDLRFLRRLTTCRWNIVSAPDRGEMLIESWM
jgi:ATPase subunit of ABC transporter with duplicated ATPase domains